MAAPRLRDDGIPFGSYTLIKRVARGGMAEVFLARQRGVEGFEREVALKRILPHLVESPEFVDMFVEEARVAARLRHPNIAHIYDFGKVDDSPFIAMEFVEGVDGAKLLDEAVRSPLPCEHLARIAADVCAGLHHAHSLRGPDGKVLGLVHRDVSPQNVLIGLDGQVKLVDFGIAKAAARVQRTRPGVVRGKFAYMSPEQCQGRELDGRSDVFNLGIILWEWLAGTTAFHRDDPVEAGKDITSGNLTPLREHRPDVPEALDKIVKRALAVDRDQRYPTAAAMQLELEAFLRDAHAASNAILLGQFVRARFRGDRSESKVTPAPLPAGRGTVPVGAVAAAGTQPVQRAAGTQPSPRPSTTTRPSTSTSKGKSATVAEVDETAETKVVSNPSLLLARKSGEPRVVLPTALVQKSKPAAPGRAPWIVAGVLLMVAAAGLAVLLEQRRRGQSAPPRAASLELRSEPAGARVVVDGVQHGELTPFVLGQLGAGPHTVALSLEGYVGVTRAVDLAAGEVRTLDIALAPAAPVVTRAPPVVVTPVPAPPSPSTSPSLSTSPSPSTRPLGRRVATADRGIGTLTVNSIPYSEVYLGKRHLGQTPIAELELAPGTYTLRLVHPGLKARTSQVVIAAGKRSKVMVNLK
ncbi:MAG: serine/threonine protein kinase [Deltaproteobacteria bacterium]|nr:serine/threonine protein kinase [Deltaproteobacteria bacterium]